MMSKSNRARQNRRDRRLAKQTNWRRPGKSNPKKVGHGGGGMVTNHNLNLKTEERSE
jgi:hypothetical protein